MFRRTIKRLAALYLAAAMLFLLGCGVGCARGAYYRGRGLAGHRTLTAENVTYQSIRPYDTDIPAGETWFVSTDTDPQLLWEGDAWVERVVLHVQQHKPATGVELYYRAAGQTEFDTRHVVYGVPDGSGGYVFDLRGQHVSGLRIDPDSVGGVLTKFDGVELNAPRPWWKALVPTGAEDVLLALAPLTLAALWAWGEELMAGRRPKLR